MKFGVVDINAVFEKSERGKSLSKELGVTRRVWSNKMQALSKKRDDLVAKLQAQPAGSDTLDMQRQLQGIEMELSYIRQHSEADLKALIQQYQQTIMSELSPMLGAFAKQQQLVAIFALPALPLVYLDPSADVTDAVVAHYNSRAAAPGIRR
jgi:Skp family chaperone for outer membrane proteins